MKTHVSFLQKATEAKLRLEAEGLFLTAEALAQLISSYVEGHSEELCLQNEPNISKACSSLTRH